MRAYAGASGVYPIPRFRVQLEGEIEFFVHATSEDRARAAAVSIYRREVLSITIEDGEPNVEPDGEDRPSPPGD